MLNLSGPQAATEFARYRMFMAELTDLIVKDEASSKSSQDPAMKNTNLQDIMPVETADDLKGGIDLATDKIPLELKNAGKDEMFQLDPARLAEFKDVRGFTPVILTIQPLLDIQRFVAPN